MKKKSAGNEAQLDRLYEALLSARTEIKRLEAENREVRRSRAISHHRLTACLDAMVLMREAEARREKEGSAPEAADYRESFRHTKDERFRAALIEEAIGVRR